MLDPWEQVRDLPIQEQPTRARVLMADRDRRLWAVNGEPLGSTPVSTLAGEPNSVSVDPHRWLRLPSGSAAAPAGVQRRREMGLYRGVVDLYQGTSICTDLLTQSIGRFSESTFNLPASRINIQVIRWQEGNMIQTCKIAHISSRTLSNQITQPLDSELIKSQRKKREQLEGLFKLSSLIRL
jgi:hypothetical protein